MDWRDLRENWLRLVGLWQRHRREQELAEELEFHLAMKMSAGQSAQEAKQEFGGLEKWKEACRDVARSRLIEEFGRDLILALRLLRKSPLFTAVALATLTLAVGANTAIFSLMNDLMLKSIPVPNARRLAILRIQPNDGGYAFSYPLFDALEQHSGAVMRVFAFSDRSFNLQTDEGQEAVVGQFVSGEYFQALGARAQLGRCIEPNDDRTGGPNGMVAVVSDHFWQNRMSGSPSILGQKITLNHVVFTIVGVLPKGFRGMSRDRTPEVFVPLRLESLVDSPFNLVAIGYRAWWLSVGASLANDIPFEQANIFLRTYSHKFFEAVPADLKLGPNGRRLRELHVIAEPGANGFSYLRLRFRKALRVLMGLVAMVLLIACLNLATLLTARAAPRGREIATRFALGANRSRLVRQLLTESMVLASTGAMLGLATAPGLGRFVATMLAGQRDAQLAPLEIRPDLRVFAFTASLSILATLFVGVVPALRSTQENFQLGIREGSHSQQGADRRHWWPRLLLGLEIALSLTLATGAGLLGYSLMKLYHTPLGFQPRGLIFLAPQGKQPLPGQRFLLAYKQALEEIRNLPNVENATVSAAVPINGMYINDDVQTPGGPKYHFQENAVGPDYFKTLQTPLLSGREFLWADTEGSGRKVILNLAAARLLFPDDKVLGRHVIFQDGKIQAEVVGVVADSKYSSMRDKAPPTVYSAAMQSLIPGASLNVVIRTTGPAAPLLTAVRKIMRRSLPDIALTRAMSMEEAIAQSLVTERMISTLAVFFGGLALLITGIGLYGTVAYSTERRTGEIGIRLALGAQRWHLISMICAENGLIAAAGCSLGILGSALASKAVANLLYGISGYDPVVFCTTTTTLLVLAMAASVIPALKAVRIDPVAALRTE